MRGSSRGAEAAGIAAFESAIRSIDEASLAEDLFAAGATIDGSATLRRALADPSRDSEEKAGLARRLFGGKVSDAATQLLAVLASQRWASERDLSDTIETLGVESVLAGAERAGRLQDVEDQLFRFERIVAGSPQLRDALTNRLGDAGRKAAMVSRLLEGKAAPETVRLARQSVLAPRGRRLDRIIDAYLAQVARRREQLTAVVTSAVPIEEAERRRLQSALGRLYGRAIEIHNVIDASVMGGLKVQIGDEVIDGTIARKLDGARRHLSG